MSSGGERQLPVTQVQKIPHQQHAHGLAGDFGEEGRGGEVAREILEGQRVKRHEMRLEIRMRWDSGRRRKE